MSYERAIQIQTLLLTAMAFVVLVLLAVFLAALAWRAWSRALPRSRSALAETERRERIARNERRQAGTVNT
jgi:membrane protein implicated in regulation of membrane protease activity